MRNCPGGSQLAMISSFCPASMLWWEQYPSITRERYPLDLTRRTLVSCHSEAPGLLFSALMRFSPDALPLVCAAAGAASAPLRSVRRVGSDWPCLRISGLYAAATDMSARP